MFKSFGPIELILILLIVLVIFGAGRLPEIGKGLGSAIRGFKDAAGGGKEDEKKEAAKAGQMASTASGAAAPTPPVETKKSA